MKKVASLFLILVMAFTLLCPCFNAVSVSAETDLSGVLRVGNWEDYIGEDVIANFEEKYPNIKVEYSTFGTNEDMYNELKINPGSIDLLCPSEYMIQKMLTEGMLESFKVPENYIKYGSEYIIEKFNSMGLQADNGDYYTVGYMWGLLGLTYNPEFVSSYDMESWSSLWNIAYKEKSTIKNSVRDSYFIGIAFAYRDELLGLLEQVEKGEITKQEYATKLEEIFNNTSDDAIKKVEDALKLLKSNIYGLEVDNGKDDVASGKITINFAWSGDAVYAMDVAEEEGVLLEYAVPKEGSNVWFDGFVMPKGANKELATAFLNYICTPEVAVSNMEYIGYTSCIAGNQDFTVDYEDENGQVETVAYTGVLDWVKKTYGVTEVPTEDNIYEANLGYFFGKTLYSAEKNRQFNTQYPTQETIERCAVMRYFDGETNHKINDMWERVKGDTLPAWAILSIIGGVILLIAGVIVYKNRDKIFKPKKAKKSKYKIVDKRYI